MKPIWGHSLIQAPIVLHPVAPSRFLARPQLLTRI
jgi:hypothetical protein